MDLPCWRQVRVLQQQGSLRTLLREIYRSLADCLQEGRPLLPA